MKRTVLLTVAVLLCAGIFSLDLSAVNLQKIHPVDTEIYQGIEHLYIQQGFALPSSSGPWSGKELVKKLNRLDYQSLNESQRELYNAIKNKIAPVSGKNEQRSASVRFGLEAAAEGYYQTNTDDFFTDEKRWRHGYPDRSPVLNFPLEVWAADHFYGYFEFPLMNSRHRDYFNQSWTTNLIFDEVRLEDFPADHNLAAHFPIRGFVSAGGERWSAQFGRDVIRWGDGISGNLIIGDHLDYHEFLRFTTYHDHFKFTTLVSSFAHPAWYYDDADTYLNTRYKTASQNEERKGFRALVGHRLEFRPWDRLSISITETMMYMGETLDFRFLNPGMLYHNYYMRSNSKSLLAVDIDFAISNNYNVYINTLLDESGIQLYPRAIGLLGGIKTSFSVGSGNAFFRLEGAYTDPYLYLRDGPPDGELGDFPIDYIVSLWQFGENFPDSEGGSEAGLFEVRRFLGYEHGNDVAALQAEAGYHMFGSWSLQGGILYLLEGTQDMYTQWDPDGHEQWAPTDEHPDNEELDAVQRTLLLEVAGNYQPNSLLEFFGHAGYRMVWNIGNQSDGGSGSDLQLSFGVSVSI